MEIRSASGEQPPEVRIVLVQPHTLIRHGMAQLLDASEGLRVIAHTGSPQEAVSLVRDFAPDVAVLDEDLLEGEGLGLLDEIKRASEAPIVLLADRATPDGVERALACGATGYLLKGSGVGDFLDGIRQAARGESVLAPEAAGYLAQSFAAAQQGHTDGSQLTPRQREILRLMAMGLENKQIARRLGIGVHTVKTHVSRILDRLDVHSRTEAVVVALRDRVIM